MDEFERDIDEIQWLEGIESLAREYAKTWLDLNGLCTCGAQVAVVRARLMPVAYATAYTMDRWSTSHTAAVLAEFIGEFMRRNTDEWSRRLHRPGASGSPTARAGEAGSDVTEHC